jgi:hypothetical protein
VTVRFTVDVEELAGGWRVTVDSEDPPNPTVIETPDLRQGCALAADVLFITNDPLARLFRAPAAPDGPRDGGGGGD